MIPAPTAHHTAHDAASPRGWVVWVRNKFLAGLALAFPLIVTFWILQFVYGLLHGWSEGLLGYLAELTKEIAGREVIKLDAPIVQRITSFVGFMIPLIVVVALGLMATNVIGVRIVAAVDKLLMRIPLIAIIYKTLKQVIDAFRGIGGSRQNFKRVVFVDYPMVGARILGFATGQFCDPNTGKAMTSVFVPTAPSPMTGLLIIVDSDKVTDAPISLEDAMKMILSGGLVGPTITVPPLNQKLAVLDAEDQSDADAPPETGTRSAQEPKLPAGLPRAEDFDSGDTEILAQAMGLEPRTRRWLPWKKKG
jgi:uncharacterized membrane protein